VLERPERELGQQDETRRVERRQLVELVSFGGEEHRVFAAERGDAPTSGRRLARDQAERDERDRSGAERKRRPPQVDLLQRGVRGERDGRRERGRSRR
jgi:hypothetical protein